eukprot:gene12773-26935_t
MIVRVRSSLGTWRVPLTGSPTSSTLSDIKTVIFAQYNIPIEAQSLSRDLQNENPLEPDSATLSSLSIGHGDLIFLNGRLEKTTVEKSYVGENGQVVSAGVSVNFKNDENLH